MLAGKFKKFKGKGVRVLKFGWEFPPYNYGGLGVACEGLVHGLMNNNVFVILVLPFFHDETFRLGKIISSFSDLLKVCPVNAHLIPYHESFHVTKINGVTVSLYSQTLFAEVAKYAEIAFEIAKKEQFDVIHAHDWMSFQAGINAKKVSNKPLVVHIHATEFDRTGGNGMCEYVYTLEKKGMESADKILVVSNHTKQQIIKYYSISEEKIEVVYNALPLSVKNHPSERIYDHQLKPIVLFLGRLTLQKGPDYFIEAARRILEIRKDITFIVSGSGDMEYRLMQRVASANITSNVIFIGFLRGKDVHQMYCISDVYVMPSVSEPFGLTALESQYHGTPIIISKNAGVSEVISHCIKVDFWDIDQLANTIISVLEYPVLHRLLSQFGKQEVEKFDWNMQAKKCIDVYRSLGIL